MKVLTVNRDEALSNFLLRILRSKYVDIEILQTNDIGEALKLLDSHRFDWVITEMLMPGGSKTAVIEKAVAKKMPFVNIIVIPLGTTLYYEAEDFLKEKGWEGIHLIKGINIAQPILDIIQ